MSDTAIRKIEKCIDRLYAEDKYLFECLVCERCLMFKLAHYLQNEFPKYFVDCEFNKIGFVGNKTEDKVEPSYDGRGLKKMYVDIIIHKRNSKTQDNFICLEIKRTRKDIDKDIKRLKMMTTEIAFNNENEKYSYNYDYGFFILLPKDKKILK